MTSMVEDCVQYMFFSWSVTILSSFLFAWAMTFHLFNVLNLCVERDKAIQAMAAWALIPYPCYHYAQFCSTSSTVQPEKTMCKVSNSV